MEVSVQLVAVSGRDASCIVFSLRYYSLGCRNRGGSLISEGIADQIANGERLAVSSVNSASGAFHDANDSRSLEIAFDS